MDLKDFVSETVTAIISGVTEAQSTGKEQGAYINPGGLTRTTNNVVDNSLWDPTTNNFVQNIEFDVAITAEDTSKGGAKLRYSQEL